MKISLDFSFTERKNQSQQKARYKDVIYEHIYLHKQAFVHLQFAKPTYSKYWYRQTEKDLPRLLLQEAANGQQ